MEKHHGYIMERIVSSDKEMVCYDGPFSIDGLPAHLCPPLFLESADVVQIRSKGCAKYLKGKETVILVLDCHVRDQCGCCVTGKAEIELDVCSATGKGNLRRGAEIKALRACFCGNCLFVGQATICVYTVVSCCEMVIPSKNCAPSCKGLPLYPRPLRHCQLLKR